MSDNEELLDYSVKLTCSLKKNHDFLSEFEYRISMAMLYYIIDSISDEC